MPNLNGINLTEAGELESHLLAITEVQQLKPVTIAIMDRTGCLVTLTRQDGAMSATVEVVISKGKTALAFDRDTIELADWPAERILNAKGALPEFTTWGGATKVYKDGIFIGICIVSGLTQEEDHELSKQRPSHWASGPTIPVPAARPSGAEVQAIADRAAPAATGGMRPTAGDQTHSITATGSPAVAPGVARSGNM